MGLARPDAPLSDGIKHQTRSKWRRLNRHGGQSASNASTVCGAIVEVRIEDRTRRS